MSKDIAPTTLTTSWEDRREFGIPYGPISAKNAKAFAKTHGGFGAVTVEVKGEGTYIGFNPQQEFVLAWMGAKNVKSVTVYPGV